MRHWSSSARPMCATCDDARFVNNPKEHLKERFPCPDCGPTANIDGTQYGRFPNYHQYKTQFVQPWEQRNLEPPPLTFEDLTPAEQDQFDEWRKQFPFETHANLLRWIDGRRYNVREDVEFQAEVKRLLALGWHLGDPLPPMDEISPPSPPAGLLPPASLQEREPGEDDLTDEEAEQLSLEV